jgi:hypothetical protein
VDNESAQINESDVESQVNDRSNRSDEAAKQGKGKRRNYSVGDAAIRMQNAVTYLKSNDSVNFSDVADKYDVDRKALRKRVEGILILNAHVGRSSYFTKEEEQRLVQHCLDMADLGYGYDLIQIRNLVRYYLQDRPITTG